MSTPDIFVDAQVAMGYVLTAWAGGKPAYMRLNGAFRSITRDAFLTWIGDQVSAEQRQQVAEMPLSQLSELYASDFLASYWSRS
jgi:hypothetical protein